MTAQALAGYMAAPYASRITLFLCGNSTERFFTSAGWGTLAQGGIEVNFVRGRHEVAELLKGGDLVPKLRSCLMRLRS